MDIETKINLIKNGSVELVDILTEKELIRLLETKQHPISYWGIATSGPLHIGYLKPINKQLDLLRAGFKHKVLIADIHAYLDDIKCPWDLLEIRTKYYKKCLELLLPEKVEFIIASSFQTSEKYIKDLYKALALVTTNRALRAASEICRIKGTPHVSELTYPLLQVIDQIYLNVDISYGGLDQRHAYALGRELIPKLGYKNAPVSIFTDRSPGLLKNTNMSASQPNTTIQLHESEYEIENKINRAYCPEKIIEKNPIIEIVKYFIFPRIKEFKIERDKKFGGDISFKVYRNLEGQYANGKIHPLDLKKATSKYLIEILKPIRRYFKKYNQLITDSFPGGY